MMRDRRQSRLLATALGGAALWAVALVPAACAGGILEHRCGCPAPADTCCESHRLGCDDPCDHTALQAPRAEDHLSDAPAETAAPATLVPEPADAAPLSWPDAPWPEAAGAATADPATWRTLPLLA
jgi:hypothetical protein